MRETLCCLCQTIIKLILLKQAFNSTSRYLDDLLNTDNPYFEQMVGQIYPTELQLNKANSSDTEALFLDLNLSITNGIVSSKGALSWYGKLTWESAHAWNLIILCLLIVWGMTFISTVHLSFYTIPLLIYDVIYDITTIPKGMQ